MKLNNICILLLLALMILIPSKSHASSIKDDVYIDKNGNIKFTLSVSHAKDNCEDGTVGRRLVDATSIEVTDEQLYNLYKDLCDQLDVILDREGINKYGYAIEKGDAPKRLFELQDEAGFTDSTGETYSIFNIYYPSIWIHASSKMAYYNVDFVGHGPNYVRIVPIRTLTNDEMNLLKSFFQTKSNDKAKQNNTNTVKTKEEVKKENLDENDLKNMHDTDDAEDAEDAEDIEEGEENTNDEQVVLSIESIVIISIVIITIAAGIYLFIFFKRKKQ